MNQQDNIFSLGAIALDQTITEPLLASFPYVPIVFDVTNSVGRSGNEMDLTNALPFLGNGSKIYIRTGNIVDGVFLTGHEMNGGSKNVIGQPITHFFNIVEYPDPSVALLEAIKMYLSDDWGESAASESEAGGTGGYYIGLDGNVMRFVAYRDYTGSPNLQFGSDIADRGNKFLSIEIVVAGDWIIQFRKPSIIVAIGREDGALTYINEVVAGGLNHQIFPRAQQVIDYPNLHKEFLLLCVGKQQVEQENTFVGVANPETSNLLRYHNFIPTLRKAVFSAYMVSHYWTKENVKETEVETAEDFFKFLHNFKNLLHPYYLISPGIYTIKINSDMGGMIYNAFLGLQTWQNPLFITLELDNIE